MGLVNSHVTLRSVTRVTTVIEYRWISHDFVEIRKLRIAYIVKGTIAGILILLAIAFAVALFRAYDVGAVLEWTIAFGFTFYLLTFFFDLRMSKGVARGELSRERLLAKKRRQGNGEPMREVNLAGENPTIPTAATAATAADVHRDGVPNSEAVVGHNSV